MDAIYSCNPKLDYTHLEIHDHHVWGRRIWLDRSYAKWVEPGFVIFTCPVCKERHKSNISQRKHADGRVVTEEMFWGEYYESK